MTCLASLRHLIERETEREMIMTGEVWATGRETPRGHPTGFCWCLWVPCFLSRTIHHFALGLANFMSLPGRGLSGEGIVLRPPAECPKQIDRSFGRPLWPQTVSEEPMAMGIGPGIRKKGWGFFWLENTFCSRFGG